MKKIIKKTLITCFACVAFASTAQAGYVVSFEPSETFVAINDIFNLDIYITANGGDTFGSTLSGMGVHIDLSDPLIGTGNGAWDAANISMPFYWHASGIFPNQIDQTYTLTGASFGGTTVVNNSILLASISLQSLGAGETTVGIDKSYPLDPGYTAFKVDGVSIDNLITYEAATINPSTAAVPIPGAVWLLGSGLAGMVAMRRKKN